MEQYYYPRTIKMITLSLLDVFNDIVIRKYSSNSIYTSAVLNQPYVSEFNVPLMFGPIEKSQSDRLSEHYYDVDNVPFGQRFYYTLPRMALVLNGISYDSTRAYGVNEWRYWFQEALGINGVDAQNAFADYQPTPYNFNYSLHIRADKLDNLSQILENILPYFNPKLFLRVKEFAFLNLERDLPVSMDSVFPEFIEDMTTTDDRYVNATINLTVEAFMYRPWTTSKVIHIINSDYFIRDALAGETVPPLSAYTFAEQYTTSGFDTSAGALTQSATGVSAVDFDEVVLSGHYQVISGTKDFYWVKTVSGGNIQ